MPEDIGFDALGIPEDSEYKRLLRRCPGAQAMRFHDGDYIVRKGESSRDAFLVLQGGYVVEQPKGDSAKPGTAVAVVVTQDPGSPSFVGEMAYLGAGSRTASVRSSGRTDAIRLSPDHLDVLIEEFPLFTRILCRQFATRLKETTAALADFQRTMALETQRVTKEPGQIIFSEGDPADELYQIVDGTVVRESESGDIPVPRAELFMGFLDPVPFFSDGTYDSTVKTVTRATVVTVPKDARENVIRRLPELALFCLASRR